VLSLTHRAGHLRTRVKIMIGLGALFGLGLCLSAALVVLGIGLFWGTREPAVGQQPTAGRRPPRTLTLVPTLTPIPSDTPSPAAPPTLTATVVPTATPAPTATMTPLPPRVTPRSAQRLPTDTPEPSATPVPRFAFAVLENDQFPTNHPDFDVYIAITDAANHPLSGYRVIGSLGTAGQVESQASAGDWTVNSGAMQYKAGNLKFQSLDSPVGVWTLRLVDEGGSPVAPSLELAFDPARPSWYFVLYRQANE